jgi:O-antigen/teichoic acid export membrane protein
MSGHSGAAVTPAPRANGLAMNFALLTGGEFTAKLLTFAAFSFLARALGPERYGSLEFALAVIVFFTLPADLGLGAYGAREIARNRSRAAALLTEIVQLRLVLATFSFALLTIFVLAIHKSAEEKALLILYGFSLLASAFMLQWFFQAHDQMQWVALASIARQFVFAGLVFACMRARAPLVWIGVFECASVMAVALFSLFVVKTRMRYGVPRIASVGRNVYQTLLKHLRQGVAIGMTELAWAFMWYFATVLLGLAFAHESLGWFGASHRLLMAAHTFVWLYFFNLLPSMSRSVTQPRRHLRDLVDRSLRFTAWAGLGVAFLGTALSKEALTLVYGPQFAGAGASFAVLVWMLPVAMLSGHYRYALLAYNLQDKLLYCTVASAILAIALGFLLVPLFGANGAAWALLAANVANFALVYEMVRRRIAAMPFHAHLYAPAVTAVGAAALFVALESAAGVWLAGAVAGGAYLGVALLFQGREAMALVRGLTTRRGETMEEPIAG